MKRINIAVALITALVMGNVLAGDDDDDKKSGKGCKNLPSHAELKNALNDVVDVGGTANGGLGNNMWATVVNRDGVVCAVVFTGNNRGDQWPGSRVISAQKANTANAFSLPTGVGFGAPLSSGNLYGTVLEEGSLLGLQFSNPVFPRVAYSGPANRFGKPNDPMKGKRIGGINVFGGGLALYDEDGNGGKLIGGLGVSGDTSCTDHIIAWRVRDVLGLDNIPGGVGDGGTNDNLILNTPPTPNSFEHPTCLNENGIIGTLATTNPTGPNGP